VHNSAQAVELKKETDSAKSRKAAKSKSENATHVLKQLNNVSGNCFATELEVKFKRIQ